MNEKTVFRYKNAIGELVFAYNSPLWITEVGGISSVQIDIAESRSVMQSGATVTNQSVQPRSFTIDGAILGYIDDIRKRVINTIAPSLPATFTIEQNGESWYLDVVPEKTPEITVGSGVQFFQTSLRAAYPFWRTVQDDVQQISGLIAEFSFPFNSGGNWWISRYSESYFSTVENSGNVPMEFRVIFAARKVLENPELYHVDTGQRIAIKKRMLAGEQVIVSTLYGKKGVACVSNKGEETNGFKYLSKDSDLSMVLSPGKNLLRCDAAVNREGLQVLIEAPKGVKSGV